MNPYYPAQSPLTRRATVPITASMLDPNIDQFSVHSIQHQQMVRTHADAATMQSQLQSHMQSNRQLQSPLPQTPLEHLPLQHENIFPTQAARTKPTSTNTERVLPSQQVTEQNIEDAYVQFILFCNLGISTNVNTTELRRGFCNPPRSDGKSFSPYTLFQLLSRLENKDGINTWTQLVTELGVEPPDQEKGQSTQKVQQYAVRLKRWLHAFHVDAFFNYLLGKPSSYQTERPSALASITETTREGIPPEEDLAIRALLPEWRPKRGRRKAEDAEADTEADSATKRLHTRVGSSDFSSIFNEQYSAAPSSAVPWSSQQSHSADPWAAAHVAIAPKTPISAQTPPSSQLNMQRSAQQMPWRFPTNDTSVTSYPQSAIIARQSFSASPAFDEPASARPSSSSASTNKSPSRTRRRPASAVSSAWPTSSQGGMAGKIRGRPPSNRSVQDGPFSTFPANPNIKDAPTTTIPTQPSASTAEVPMQSSPRPTTSSPKPGNVNPDTTGRKPSKLQLQVPPHAGGPIRLATPPTVLINGESDKPAPTSATHNRRTSAEFFSHLDGISEEDAAMGEQAEGSVGSDEGADGGGGTAGDGTKEEWKRRALLLKRKLAEKEEELKAVKRRVLEAVM